MAREHGLITEMYEALRDLLDASSEIITNDPKKLNAAQVKAAAVLAKVSDPKVTAAKG